MKKLVSDGSGRLWKSFGRYEKVCVWLSGLKLDLDMCFLSVCLYECVDMCIQLE